MGAKSSMMVLLSKQRKGPEEVVNGSGSSTEVRELNRSRGAREEELLCVLSSSLCTTGRSPEGTGFNSPRNLAGKIKD